MKSPHAESLSIIAEKALNAFNAKHDAREQGLKISRDVIRLSANAVRAVHRGEFDIAEELIEKAKTSLQQTDAILARLPEIYHSGYLADARKEFSEANITLAVLTGRTLPQPEDIDTDVTAYLKGLGDAAGEMRRFILDCLRKDDWGRCEEIMEVMDELYGLLVTMDFPEGVTGGLRRTTDMVRGTLERTRGDLTMAMRQRQLEKRLTSWENTLGEKTAAPSVDQGDSPVAFTNTARKENRS